mmetsp:Transcript_106636/g.183872  ORF Transcript_106636/g.183872 Transcript_106636/m.183872 type:complete len:329 (-) Transcript_106636:498-1484(-)
MNFDNKQASLTRSDFIQLKLRLDSSAPDDVHRKFLGYYYPGYRSLAIFELRTIVGVIKTLPIFVEDKYLKPDGSTYLVEDLEVGRTIVLGALRNQKDGGTTKPFVIEQVDASNMTSINHPSEASAKQTPIVVHREWEELRTRFQKQFDGTDIRSLGSIFTVKDKGGRRTATPQELFKAFTDLGKNWAEADIADMVTALDCNGDGLLSYEEFMFICRGQMSEPRRQCIRSAFIKVDYNKSGCINFDEFKVFYNPAYDAQVITGEITAEEIVRNTFNDMDTDGNGKISWTEFEDYYNGLGAIMASDDDFVNVMQRTWNLDGRNPMGIAFH